MIAQQISHYHILSKIGAGGMGEVYRARDSRLNRDVAIKVLPDGCAQDAERLARFQREAQVLASLNHSNIAAIYGFEQSETTCALVMELVEGPTLAERMATGPLPVDESLAIARQIAEALEAAHERGIIHRDLKPANIKVTPDGLVKVLDFGLAKIFEEQAAETELSHSPTLIKGTQAGVILGTAAYMSPEQAQGKVIDKRCDIWAFGVVLYEMLAGRQLFTGETVSDTLAAVLRDEVDWQALPAETPTAVRRLLRRCLERDRRQRLRDIGEARIAIENESKQTFETETSRVVASTGLRRHVWLALALALAVMAAAAAIVLGLRTRNPELPLRKSFILARGLVADILQRPALSPDGKKVVYMANGKLWLQELGLYQARELPGTEGPRRPFWSPDSEWVGFGGNDGRLRKVSVRDGTVSVICHTSGTFGVGAGGAWLTSDRIVFSTGAAGLFQVSPQGGEPTSYLDINEETDSDFHEASPLPDGKGVLFLRHRKGGTIDQLELFAGGKRKLLFSMPGEGLQFPVYSPSGHVLFQRITGNPGIWALPFSLEHLETTGEPFLAAQGAFPSVSNDGTLLFVRAESTTKQLGWVSRKGEVSRLLGGAVQGPEGPAVSPDGRKVAISIFEGGSWEVFVLDSERNTRVRLTFAERKVKLTPWWSPDGRNVFFSQLNPDQIWKVPADGSGKAELLIAGYRPHVTPDGAFLVFQLRGLGKNLSDIFYKSLANPNARTEPSSVRTIVEGTGDDSQAVVSPDVRYMAYQSDENGGYQIYIKRFPNGEGKWQASVAGGAFPRWSRDRRELFFSDLSTNDLMVVPVELGANITLGTPQRLFSGNAIGAELSEGFDVSPDGKEFVVVLNGASSNVEKGISIVQNWFSEFKNR